MDDNKKEIDWEKEIEKNWWKLDLAPDEFGKNKDVVMSALKQDGTALRYASEELRGDWHVVAEAVCRDGEMLAWASDEMRADSKLIHWALGISTSGGGREDQIDLEEWTGPDHSEYNEIATSRAAQPNALRHATEEARGNDIDTMLSCVKAKWFAAEHILAPLRESKNFWRRVIQQDEENGWQAFAIYAPVAVREDKALMAQAIQADPLALHYAGPGLRKSNAFILEMVSKDWRCLRWSPDEFRSDAEILTTAAKQDLGALDYALGDLGKLAIQAVRPQVANKASEKTEWKGLAGADEEERKKKHQAMVKEEWREILLDLTEKNARAFSLAKASGVDRELTEKAIKRSGQALAYAEPEYREDRQLVNESVRTNIGFCSGLLWRSDLAQEAEAVSEEEDVLQAPKPKAKSKGKAKAKAGGKKAEG
mmetsp:Transcript_43311/g.77825  ORF Transcript_43311/g.77825 Transcript_43311/m.77825 type:complete len:424 (-) Transcript_43311:81-1352(-)|eukprot:CAMPEP_0197656908 /NCGR_PEP_ID=MMETSP1338-20131121/43904_1 /TAXON_ID=43686 ORGANISM="Pelagodinium beii, Strain RCC1491" /NCGR_SAMPLE_ID=MMETSP1338 /ASSEMBLY_ACC=CAM_ASM_000754 /LENGTH=423 /DNA_ID=CAMNT_0043233133 /DNA_START=35 /DNA_END=1306 /DNA_ORIENTATION=+